MKKKIIAFCLLIAMLCTFLIGCGLVDTDDEKDLQRVIALVGNPDVYQDEIKKYELVNYYASVNQQYNQQGYGDYKSMKDLLKEMINERIKVQKAVGYLLEDFLYGEKNRDIKDYVLQNGFTYYEISYRSGEYSQDKIDTDLEYENYNWKKKNIKLTTGMGIKDVLAPTGDYTTSQILTALLRCYYGNSTDVINKLKEIEEKSGNEGTKIGFKLYYETLKDSSLFSDHLIIGALNEVWASEKSSLDTIENRLREENGKDAIEEESSSSTGTRPIPKKDKEDRFILPKVNEEIIKTDTTSLRTAAFSEYEAQIKENIFGMSYKEFYEKQLVSALEQKALARHSELMVENNPVDEKEFEDRFKAIMNSEKQGFDLDLSSYETKLQNLNDNTFVLYNPVDGVYGYVKHILLGLDTDLNKGLQRELDKLKALELSRKDYLDKRNKILDGIMVKDLREDVKAADDDRFPGYDEYFGFIDTEYSMTDFYGNFKAKFGAGNEKDGIFQYDPAKFSDEDAMLDEFEKWMYMYNTDSGIFSKDKGYLVAELLSMNADSTNSDLNYMAEFAKASRDLIATGKTGSYILVATDYGYHLIILSEVITTNKDDLDGVLEEALAIYKKIAEGKETEADKKTAAYKLYQIIKSEHGQESYTDAINAAINEYYRLKYYELYESKYQDLLEN